VRGRETLHIRLANNLTACSGVGKTQFLLTLLLSAQLPPPQGLSRSTIYMSTEAQLSTKRLNQILLNHRRLYNLPSSTRPSLDKVRSIPIQDLESQEHILEYQVPIMVQRYNVGLVVVDSVAANYRAEHGSSVLKDLANRAAQLAKLGRILRRLAITENLAVVVANQVSDRFEPIGEKVNLHALSSSPSIPSSQASQAQNALNGTNHKDQSRTEIMSLDYQQRFFTGWGDNPRANTGGLKTPALGLGWTNQIAARIVLKMDGNRVINQTPGAAEDYMGGNLWGDRKKRRFLTLAFAPWVVGTLTPVEFEIRKEGLVSIESDGRDHQEYEL
jgi:DNA repair protein RAD57